MNLNLKCFFLFTGYEGQNNAQTNNASGGDGTSSLDCLSLIVESISPGAAAVAGLLQGQGRQPVRLQASTKQEETGEHTEQSAAIIKLPQ